MKNNFNKILVFFIVLNIVLFLNSCAGCSNRNSDRSTKVRTSKSEKIPNEAIRSVRDEVQMSVNGGVYEVPVQINGSKMNFIFDTGASAIVISQVEAGFLIKQGTLDESDVLGETEMSDANGDISSGYVVKLRTVQIGNRILNNVEAIIVPNSKAPLLLGQTALAQFGKISIDYNRNVLSFE